MFGNTKVTTAKTGSISDLQKDKYTGSDPLMDNGDSMSIFTLKRAYLKMLDLDDSIGWDEMIDELGNTLSQIMGEDQFLEWDAKYD